jgi:hypothetical protein
MSTTSADKNTNTLAELNADFKLYTVDHSNPNSHIVSNVHFVAPAGSYIHISLDRNYHDIAHEHPDGAARIHADYGHRFTIIDRDGNTIATGCLDGLHFTTIAIGTVTKPAEQSK